MSFCVSTRIMNAPAKELCSIYLCKPMCPNKQTPHTLSLSDHTGEKFPANRRHLTVIKRMKGKDALAKGVIVGNGWRIDDSQN